MGALSKEGNTGLKKSPVPIVPAMLDQLNMSILPDHEPSHFRFSSTRDDVFDIIITPILFSVHFSEKVYFKFSYNLLYHVFKIGQSSPEYSEFYRLKECWSLFQHTLL